MPRKTPVKELQKEEAAGSSPLRRSSRISSNSPAPTKVTSRRSSATETTSTPKVTRTRRSSFSQELESANENAVESKTPRPRRGSFSSKNTENNVLPEEVVTKRGTRASSVSKEESSDAKATISRRRRAASEEIEMNEDIPTKTKRSRSGSVSKNNAKTENENLDEDHPVEVKSEINIPVEGSSLMDIPNKTLESIDEEFDKETDSPGKSEPKINTTKKKKDNFKIDLDLSVINETSLTEEDIRPQEENIHVQDILPEIEEKEKTNSSDNNYTNITKEKSIEIVKSATDTEIFFPEKPLEPETEEKEKSNSSDNNYTNITKEKSIEIVKSASDTEKPFPEKQLEPEMEEKEQSNSKDNNYTNITKEKTIEIVKSATDAEKPLPGKPLEPETEEKEKSNSKNNNYTNITKEKSVEIVKSGTDTEKLPEKPLDEEIEEKEKIDSRDNNDTNIAKEKSIDKSAADTLKFETSSSVLKTNGPNEDNTLMKANDSVISDSSFNLQLSSSVLECSSKSETDGNISPTGNKENIRPKGKTAEFSDDPMDVDESDLENSSRSKSSKIQSPKVTQTVKVINNQATYAPSNSPTVMNKNRLSLTSPILNNKETEFDKIATVNESTETKDRSETSIFHKQKEDDVVEEKCDNNTVLDKREESTVVPPSIEENTKNNTQMVSIEATLNKTVVLNGQDNQMIPGDVTEENIHLETNKTNSLNDSKTVEEVIRGNAEVEPITSNAEEESLIKSTSEDPTDNSKDELEISVTESITVKNHVFIGRLINKEVAVTPPTKESDENQITEGSDILEETSGKYLESENVNNRIIQESTDSVDLERIDEENSQTHVQISLKTNLKTSISNNVTTELENSQNETLTEKNSTKFEESSDNLNTTDNVTDANFIESVSSTLSETINGNDNNENEENNGKLKSCGRGKTDVGNKLMSVMEMPSPVNVIIKSDILVQASNEDLTENVSSEQIFAKEKVTNKVVDKKLIENDSVQMKEMIPAINVCEEINKANKENELEEEISYNSFTQNEYTNVSCRKKYNSPKKIRSKLQILDCSVSNSSDEEAYIVKENKHVITEEKLLAVIDSKYEIISDGKEGTKTLIAEDNVSDSSQEIVIVSDDEQEDQKDKKIKKHEEIVSVDGVQSKEKKEDTKETVNEILVSSNDENKRNKTSTEEDFNKATPINDDSVISNKRRSVDKTSIVMQGNIKAGDNQEKCLNDRIHQMVDLFCAGIKNTSSNDVSINVSLEYTGHFSDSDITDTVELSFPAVTDCKEKKLDYPKGSKRRKLHHSDEFVDLRKSAKKQEIEHNEHRLVTPTNPPKNKNKSQKSTSFNDSNNSFSSPEMGKSSSEKTGTGQRKYKDTPYKSSKSSKQLVNDNKENKLEVYEDTQKGKKKTPNKKKSDNKEVSQQKNKNEIKDSVKKADEQTSAEWKPFSKYFSSVSSKSEDEVNDDENDITWAPSREIDSDDSDLSSDELDDTCNTSLKEIEEHSSFIIKSPLIPSYENIEENKMKSSERDTFSNDSLSFIYKSNVGESTDSESDDVFDDDIVKRRSPGPNEVKTSKKSDPEDYVTSEVLHVEEIQVEDGGKKQKKKKTSLEANKLSNTKCSKGSPKLSTNMKDKKPVKRHHSNNLTLEEAIPPKKASVSQKVPTVVVSKLSESKRQVTEKEYTKTFKNKSSTKKLGKMNKTRYFKPSSTMSACSWDVKEITVLPSH